MGDDFAHRWKLARIGDKSGDNAIGLDTRPLVVVVVVVVVVVAEANARPKAAKPQVAFAAEHEQEERLVSAGRPARGSEEPADRRGKGVALRSHLVRQGPAFKRQARQPERSIENRVAKAGMIPIDDPSFAVYETQIVRADIHVQKLVALQWSSGLI